MHTSELTLSDMLRDPMIRLMLRADRVPLGEFAKLLEDAASARRRQNAANEPAPSQRPH